MIDRVILSALLFVYADATKRKVVFHKPERMAEPSIYNIDVEVEGVKSTVCVLQASQPRECIFIEFQPDQVETLLKKLWCSSWSTDTMKRDPTLPKGVHRQRGKYVAMVGGKRKFFADRETASIANIG